MRIHVSIPSVATARLAPVSMDPSRERGWHVLLIAAALGALMVVLVGCSAAESQTGASNAGNAGKEYFFMSLNSPGSSQGSSLSSPLPASSGLYQFNSWYYTCQSLSFEFVPQLHVVAGPDKGLVFGLTVIGGDIGAQGGTLKFWLQPMDQIQFIDQLQFVALGGAAIPPNVCTMYLYGEVVDGTLQTLQ